MSLFCSIIIRFIRKELAREDRKFSDYYYPQLKACANVDNTTFIIRKLNIDSLSSFLFSFYLNRAVFKNNDSSTQYSNYHFNKIVKASDSNESFAFKINLFENFKYTILDFMLSCYMLDSLFIINFKKYIQNILKQNKQIQNCEFRLKSPHTLEMICIRNDLTLFEIFYKIEISNSAEASHVDNDIKNPNIFNYEDYYLSIDFVKCFQIVEKNDNEQMAIYLFQLLSYVIKKFGIMNKLRHYDLMFSFNEKFLKEFMQKIFEKKWYHLMKVILDLAHKKTFIYLNDAEFKTESKLLNSSLQSKQLKFVLFLWRKI